MRSEPGFTRSHVFCRDPRTQVPRPASRPFCYTAQQNHCPRLCRTVWVALLLGHSLAHTSCRKAPVGCTKQGAPASAVTVTVNPRGSITLKTPAAEFDILPGGYVDAR